MLKFQHPTPEQRKFMRDLRYAQRKDSFFRLDARAKFKNARTG